MLRDVQSLESLVDDLSTDLDRIQSSLLAPWQKLDCIRTFIQPCLTFALRAGEPQKQSLTKYKKKLIETVRSICNLPLRATSYIIFASSRVGGLGFQDPLLEVDAQSFKASAKLMSLPDQVKVARALVKDAFSNGSSWLFTGLNLRFKDW
jgi:hypothetical protein